MQAGSTAVRSVAKNPETTYHHDYIGRINLDSSSGYRKYLEDDVRKPGGRSLKGTITLGARIPAVRHPSAGSASVTENPFQGRFRHAAIHDQSLKAGIGYL